MAFSRAAGALARRISCGLVAGDVVAGVTLAAYAIPVSLAYAGLAGLPPQVGVYGYLLGGLGYALLGSSRQLAIGPTSAISLMIAGTVGAMAEGDAQRYAQIASLAGFTVAALCLIAWLLRLSVLVKLISDSILVGFKAGAALTIAMTQLPSLLGVAGGGHNFFERAVLLAGQLGQMNLLVLALGVVAIVLLVFGERLLPGRPVALGVVALSIVAASVLGLPALGVATTGEIPAGLPTLGGPGAAAARCRGDCSAGGRMPAARLYRRRVRGPHLRGQARICPGSAAGASRHRRGEPRGGAGTWLSRRGRSVAIGGERQGGRAHAARARLRVDHARALPALPHRAAGKPAEGRAGCGRADRRLGTARFSGAVAHVARKPARLLRCSDRPGRRAASGDTAGNPARRTRLRIDAAGPRVAPARGVPRPHSRHEQLLRPRPSSRKRGAARRDRFPSRSVADLRQCRCCAGSRLEPTLAAAPSDIRLVVCDLSASPYLDLAGSRMLHELHASLPPPASHCASSERVDGCATCCEPTACSDKVGGLDRTATIESLLGGEGRQART